MGSRLYLKFGCIFYPIVLNYLIILSNDHKYVSPGKVFLFFGGVFASIVIYVGEKYRRELFIIER